ncbi:MAG: biotin--[acetyl-CoA-carboxylase] ligase, partial [Planctomycetota bacterium]
AAKAIAFAADPSRLPLLVVAERQTAGRGRGGRRWWSGSGALTFSLLIAPSRHGLENRAGVLSIATALAVCDAVERVGGVQALVKWPNDVLVRDRKCAGVLLESPARDRLVIGVGVNVRNRVADGPPDVRDDAISLADAGASVATPAAILAETLERLAERIDQLAAGDERLAGDLAARCFLTGREVTLAVGGRRETGVCVGVAPNGALRLSRGDTVTAFRTGSVEAVGPQN